MHSPVTRHLGEEQIFATLATDTSLRRGWALQAELTDAITKPIPAQVGGIEEVAE